MTTINTTIDFLKAQVENMKTQVALMEAKIEELEAEQQQETATTPLEAEQQRETATTPLDTKAEPPRGSTREEIKARIAEDVITTSGPKEISYKATVKLLGYYGLTISKFEDSEYCYSRRVGATLQDCVFEELGISLFIKTAKPKAGDPAILLRVFTGDIPTDLLPESLYRKWCQYEIRNWCKRYGGLGDDPATKLRYYQAKYGEGADLYTLKLSTLSSARKLCKVAGVRPVGDKRKVSSYLNPLITWVTTNRLNIAG